MTRRPKNAVLLRSEINFSKDQLNTSRSVKSTSLSNYMHNYTRKRVDKAIISGSEDASFRGS